MNALLTMFALWRLSIPADLCGWSCVIIRPGEYTVPPGWMKTHRSGVTIVGEGSTFTCVGTMPVGKC